MIEGGGLGIFRPEEVGPMEVQVPNGVVDIAVDDEAEAVQVARKYLSYFQGPVSEWECADQRRLRGIIPENRLRVYDVRTVIETLADTGSVLELRPRVRADDDHRVHPDRGASVRRGREQPEASGRRDRQRWRRQGRALHAAVRRVRHSAPVPVRHARHHGRSGNREDRAGAALLANVRDGGERRRAVLHDRAAQGLRPGRDRDGRRQLRSRRCSPWRGRPASSVRWDSRVR